MISRRLLPATVIASCLATALIATPAVASTSGSPTSASAASVARITPPKVELLELQKGDAYIKITSTPGFAFMIENGTDDGTPESGAIGPFGFSTKFTEVRDDDVNTLRITVNDEQGNSASSDLVVDATRFDFYAPTVDVTSSSDASQATIDVTGEKGAHVEVRDLSGAPVAGGTLSDGHTTMVISTPRKAATYSLTLIDPTTGEKSPVRQFSVHGDLEGPDLGPVEITDVATNGDRSALTLKGQVGAVVKLRDENGNLLGMKMVGRAGSTTVPLTTPQEDEEIVATQEAYGIVSDETTSVFSAPPKVEIGRVTPNNALVRFEGPRGTTSKLIVRDESGTIVARTALPSLRPIALAFSVPSGTTRKLTAEREFGDFHSATTFTLTGGGAALEKPTVKATAAGNLTNLVVHGEPFAVVTVTDEDGFDVVNGFDENGLYVRSAVTAGSRYTVTQNVKTDYSEAVTITIPAR